MNKEEKKEIESNLDPLLDRVQSVKGSYETGWLEEDLESLNDAYCEMTLAADECKSLARMFEKRAKELEEKEKVNG